MWILWIPELFPCSVNLNTLPILWISWTLPFFWNPLTLCLFCESPSLPAYAVNLFYSFTCSVNLLNSFVYSMNLLKSFPVVWISLTVPVLWTSLTLCLFFWIVQLFACSVNLFKFLCSVNLFNSFSAQSVWICFMVIHSLTCIMFYQLFLFTVLLATWFYLTFFWVEKKIKRQSFYAFFSSHLCFQSY